MLKFRFEYGVVLNVINTIILIISILKSRRLRLAGLIERREEESVKDHEWKATWGDRSCGEGPNPERSSENG
jgi:hypothetical protein